MKTFNRFFVRAVLAASLLFGTSHLAQALEVGEKAPDFELDSTAGGKLKLSSLKGKNVLINVYVLDYSPTWIKHLMSAGSEDNYKKFTAENTEVLGMSANAAFSQKAFVDFVKVKYPLLSDRDGKAIKAFGVWDEERRLAKRSYVLIDKEGVVRFINTRPTNTEKDLLSTEALLDEVKKINKK